MLSKKKEKHKKFTLSEFVWMGFNYTVGIGFIGNFAILSNINQPNSIGINAIWVFVVIGIIAGICAWAFAKMARVHLSNNNGAAYIYVRSTFGKLCGIFVAFMNYISLPFLITIQVMMLIKGSFSPEWIMSSATDPIPWYAAQWGSFTDLWLDLIGILIYTAASLIIFLGIKHYKRFANGSGIIKWATSAVLILLGLVLAVKNGSTNLPYWASKSQLTFSGFIKAFNSCFFFFAGFEVYSTAGRNIHKPEKNIGRGIILIMFISTIFYLVVSIIFFAGYSTFLQNMNMGAWNNSTSKIVLYGGPIIMIISALALKINAAMQNALYGGTTLQPLAVEGFISDKFRKLNKEGLPVRASLLNLLITAAMILIWLGIPDFVKGIYLTQQFGFNCTVPQLMSYKAPFDISSLTEASSAITIFIYAMVIAVTIKLGKDKKIVMKVWEWVVFPIIFIILCLTFFWHYYSLIMTKIVNVAPEDRQSDLIGVIIELVFILSAVSFAIIWYYTYYRRKYLKRLKKRPDIQPKLDSEFVIVDDWKYVSRELKQELSSYLIRNKNIFNDEDNINLNNAKRMLQEINTINEHYQALENEEDEKIYEQ